jgi:hypothetical protein
VALASVTGNILTVTPMLSGISTITITADDGFGGTVETSFEVEVNSPPVVLNAIADTSLAPNSEGLVLDLTSLPVFSDPDGDALTFTADTLNAAVAYPIIAGNLLTIVPVALGNTTITVTAKDGRGGLANTSFVVTVNTLPSVVNAISNQRLVLGGEAFMRILSESPFVFGDPDGDDLSFSVVSSDGGVAGAFLSGDTLTVTPIDAGTAIITVTATDTRGGSRQMPFEVSVIDPTVPPVISHTAISSVVAQSEAIPIEVTIEDEIISASLYYRSGGRPDFSKREMSKSGSRIHGDIPAEAVTARGVEYYIEATNLFGVPGQSPNSGYYSIQVAIAEPGLPSDILLGGNEQTAYRLVSVPLDLDDKRPSTVLDEFGSYDITKWRFFGFDTLGQRVEYSEVNEIVSGRAYWLIVKEGGRAFESGAGKTNLTSRDYQIPLHSGWNAVGNPFNFSIPVSNLRMASGANVDSRYYDGKWNPEDFVSSFEPFEGYAVFASGVDTLFIDPDLSGLPKASQPATLAVNQRMAWSIQILARCQDAQDIDNMATVNPSADIGWDIRDYPEPPVIGEYVTVYFPHPEWGDVNKAICVDARPEPTEMEIWEFAVRTNIRDQVDLTFEGIDMVPEEFEVWLVDERLQLTQNLRNDGHFTLAGAGDDYVKNLKLVVGDPDFVAEELGIVNAIPSNYELSQNFPNPFNPVTTIRYGLPTRGRVTLKIYNLLGEEVVILVNDEQKDAGYHVAIWDGRNSNGQRVGTGLYFCQFRGPIFLLTRKMALIQ